MSDITHLQSGDGTALLALNNVFAAETSFLTSDAWSRLAGQARPAYAAGSDGFLIAFDEHADYDSPNFAWHKARSSNFIYIDRVVIAASAQGRGLGRAFYERLFVDARAAGFDSVTCEVNLDPPNPASLVFHERLGFQAVGDHSFSPAKTVRYFRKPL